MIQIQIQVQFIDKVVIVFVEWMYKLIKCRSLCKTVEVPQVPFVDMVIVVPAALQRRHPRSAENAAVHRGVPKDIKWITWLTFFTYDGWDARKGETGAEHPDDCRDIVGAVRVAAW